MAVRRRQVLSIGGFDEQLGPGGACAAGRTATSRRRALAAGWWVLADPRRLRRPPRLPDVDPRTLAHPTRLVWDRGRLRQAAEVPQPRHPAGHRPRGDLVRADQAGRRLPDRSTVATACAGSATSRVGSSPACGHRSTPAPCSTPTTPPRRADARQSRPVACGLVSRAGPPSGRGGGRFGHAFGPHHADGGSDMIRMSADGQRRGTADTDRAWVRGRGVNRIIRISDNGPRPSARVGIGSLRTSDDRRRRRGRRRRRRRRAAALAVLVVVAAAVLVTVLVRRAAPVEPVGVPAASVATRAPVLHVPAAVSPSVPGFVNTLAGSSTGPCPLTADGAPLTIEPGGAFTMLSRRGRPRSAWRPRPPMDRPRQPPWPSPTDHPGAGVPGHRGGARPRSRTGPTRRSASRSSTSRRRRRIGAVELDIKDEAGEIGYLSTVPFATTDRRRPDRTTTRSPRSTSSTASACESSDGSCASSIPSLAGWAWDQRPPRHDRARRRRSAPLANDYGTAAFTQPRQPRDPPLPDRPRQRSRRPRLRRDPLRLRPPPRRRPRRDAAPRPRHATRCRRRPLRRRHPTPPSPRPAPTSASRSSASPPPAPKPIGQDISLLAPHVDYVAPMVYPSHWGPGEYGVADPLRQPADIVRRSVADFERLVAGSGAAVVPWLQDFSSGGVTYGAAEVARPDRRRPRGRRRRASSCGTPAPPTTIDALDPPTG